MVRKETVMDFFSLFCHFAQTQKYKKRRLKFVFLLAVKPTEVARDCYRSVGMKLILPQCTGCKMGIGRPQCRGFLSPAEFREPFVQRFLFAASLDFVQKVLCDKRPQPL